MPPWAKTPDPAAQGANGIGKSWYSAPDCREAPEGQGPLHAPALQRPGESWQLAPPLGKILRERQTVAGSQEGVRGLGSGRLFYRASGPEAR